MCLNCVEQIIRAPIVQEENSLANSPQWRASEFVWTCLALDNVVREPSAHMVDQQV